MNHPKWEAEQFRPENQASRQHSPESQSSQKHSVETLKKMREQLYELRRTGKIEELQNENNQFIGWAKVFNPIFISSAELTSFFCWDLKQTSKSLVKYCHV